MGFDREAFFARALAEARDEHGDVAPGVLLAGHGALPAPWALGEAAGSLREEFDEHDSYADAWSLWVLHRFDDAKTWSEYLQAQPRPSKAWAKAVARLARW